ncbi:MAG: PTS sugar transporter subunit IIA [Spirochaetota bacterium]|nr:MAG: PTS sugar transporter subunit IIA [Spirochaetota bacterium]
MNINLIDYLSINRICFTNSDTKELTIDELINVSREDNKVSDVASFKSALLKRDTIMSTGIGYGVAIPHVKMAGIEDFFITIGIHKRGVDWDSLDNKPTYLIFLIAGPENQQERYLRILASLTMVIKDPERRKRLITCNTKYEVFELLVKAGQR